MTRGSASFRTQVVVRTTALVAAVMLLAGIGVQLLLEATARRDVGAALDARADAVVASVRAASTVRLTVPDAVLEPGVQVYASDRRLLAGSVPQRALETVRALSGVSVTTERAVGDDVQVRAVPFDTPSGGTAVAVVTVETEPYQRAETYGLLAVALLGLVVVVVTAVTTRRVTGRALEPVTRMAARAEEWSEHDLGRRFGLGPPTNELAALGHTLDRLLDRVARAIRSEQRLTSELAHELRTPLTAIQGSADLALLRGVDDPILRYELEEIARSSRTMAETITTLLDLAREQSRGDGGDRCTVAGLVPEVRALVPAHLRFEADEGDAVPPLAAPAALVLRALAPLVQNAVEHARGTVGLAAAYDDRFVLLSVTDDGPGVDPQVGATLFDPGVSARRDRPTGAPPRSGSGLGLGIARRVARSIGGDVATRMGAGPTTFTLRVPRA